MTPPDQVVAPPPNVSAPPLRYWVVEAPVIVPPPLAVSVDPRNVPPDQAKAPLTPSAAFPPRLPLLNVKPGTIYGPALKFTVPPAILAAVVNAVPIFVVPPVNKVVPAP